MLLESYQVMLQLNRARKKDNWVPSDLFTNKNASRNSIVTRELWQAIIILNVG